MEIQPTYLYFRGVGCTGTILQIAHFFDQYRIGYVIKDPVGGHQDDVPVLHGELVPVGGLGGVAQNLGGHIGRRQR